MTRPRSAALTTDEAEQNRPKQYSVYLPLASWHLALAMLDAATGLNPAMRRVVDSVQVQVSHIRGELS